VKADLAIDFAPRREAAIAAEAAPLLAVRDLQVHFELRAGTVRAVDGLSFHVEAGETLGIVGESGCGKSITALSILGLVQTPPGRIVAGAIELKGRNLVGLPEGELRKVRGNEIAMVFQEPMSSLNPVLTIGRQITEVLRLHGRYTARDARRRAVELLDLVRIPDAARRFDQYPHEMSGGMRQRVMIAMALSCSPKLLIADEPTTALDVTIQAQIIDLFLELKERLRTSILLITHDLGVVAAMATRVAVMYAGRKVEEGPVDAVLGRPLHPYTLGLLGAIPDPELGNRTGTPSRLKEIPGSVPSMLSPVPGCSFASRCAYATGICGIQFPPLEELDRGHWVACWNSRVVVAS
jgi:peptide/nickel transport system ATP-binding protein